MRRRDYQKSAKNAKLEIAETIVNIGLLCYKLKKVFKIMNNPNIAPSFGDKEAQHKTVSSNRLRSIFDAAYRGATPATGDSKRPPWSFGEPQPEMAALVDAGHFHGRVLDVGCGEGELALYSGAHGLNTLGVDASETAIRRAREAAGRAAMNNVEFALADVTDLSGLDGQFDTIVDCTLFHSLPLEHRDSY